MFPAYHSGWIGWLYPILLPGLALALGALVIADFMRWSSLVAVVLSTALIAWLDPGSPVSR